MAIAQQRKLNNGTKELILNALYRQPAHHRAAGAGPRPLPAGRPPPCGGAARQRADPRGGRARGRAPVGPRTLLRPQLPGRARRRSGRAPARAGRARRRGSPRSFGPGRPALAEAFAAHQPAGAGGAASRRCSTTSSRRPPAWRGSGWRPTATCPPGRSTTMARAGCGGRRSRRKRRWDEPRSGALESGSDVAIDDATRWHGSTRTAA